MIYMTFDVILHRSGRRREEDFRARGARYVSTRLVHIFEGSQLATVRARVLFASNYRVNLPALC